MNIEYCKEFIELAQSLSYTEAASLLNTTQSTLSKHILALEKEFNARFFDRNRKEVKLTEEGRVFFEYATMFLAQYEELKTNLTDMQKNQPIHVIGHVSDSEVSAVCSTAVMLARNRFHSVCTLDHEARNCDSLKLGEVFIGYANPVKAQEHGLKLLKIFDSPLCVITNTDHALAKQKTIQWDDLRDQVFIRFVGDIVDPAWEQVEQTCIAHGFKPKTRSISSNNEVEFFSTPIQTSVLIWKRTDSQIDLLLETGMRSCSLIEGDDALLSAYLVYHPADETLLENFINATKEAASLRKTDYA